MGFEEASKKYSRFALLIMGGVITLMLYAAPLYTELSELSAKTLVESRHEWIIVFVVIINFYFKEKEA
ncbi:MAG: hypothetical protein HOL31_02100 [Candidatus Scalindua sp.]|jgi:hypothetical protein|nr:hypothetical protein [Candidatus Scalindua sp.]MBT7349695.1 hypothetical protein [candidate division WWE3 bacterium]